MLLYSRKEDIPKMNQYYRTSDMIKLLKYFPDLSPITDLTIVENEMDYLDNVDYINTLKNNREDTLKTNIDSLNTDNKGIGENFIDILRFIKTVDKDAVLVLFNTSNVPSERYERYAGISIGVILGEYVKIDAVGKGFDGREVSKNICTHERYDIPWFDLRRITTDNFRTYRTFLINDEEYQETRKERATYLEKIGYEKEIVEKALPEKYIEIPDFIWSDIVKNLLKKLEKEEDILRADGVVNFAISGHTEGKDICRGNCLTKQEVEVANMNSEYEVRVLNIDVDKFIEQIKGLGATYVNQYFQKRYIYDFNPKIENKWIRLRTDGFKTTLAIKEYQSTEIGGTKELEIEVSDIEKTNEILNQLGYFKRSIQENKRIRYMLDDVEIDIDTWPHLNTYVEFEGKSERTVLDLIKKLGIDEKDITTMDAQDIYLANGFTLEDLNNLRF